MMPKGTKLTYQEVVELFRQEGCELLSKSYVSNASPLEYRCSCGDIAVTTEARFKRGSRCHDCGVKRGNEKKRKSQEEVAAIFASEGCELLGNYENNYSFVRYRCSCGNESETQLFRFQYGQRCKACYAKRHGGSNHYRWVPNRELLAEKRTFRSKCANSLHRALSAVGGVKWTRTIELLGYTPEQLRNYITSHPNWPVLKDEKWHLDHIFPVKAFLDYGITDIRLMNCLENLRPLLGKENMQKNDRYSREDFERWLTSRGVEYSSERTA